MPSDERASAADALTVLASGEVEVRGRMPWSSNATFLVDVHHQGTGLPAVYKPQRGERELWDFPDGLYRREVAAYHLSLALGWRLVPETVVREDAPLGVGSLQRFVPADFDQHYFTLLEEEEHHDALRRIAVFDVLANNADRKSGHCLLDEDGHIWAIDNGLSFHVEPKLRTVIWDFAGQRVAEPVLADVERLATDVPGALCELLHPVEVDALVERARRLLRVRKLPMPPPGYRAYPWPLV
ncbi:MAG TPA: SCO1664 family protein [Acidimicrobiales bacterium]|nr:SCO1664 family protein [Acidimicrobiales bacterium]